MLEIVTSLIDPAIFERIFALLLDASIKGTLMLSLATVVGVTLRKGSAAARHRMWALTLLSLLALPLLPPVTPAVWSVTVPTPMAMFVPSRAVSTAPASEPTMSFITTIDEPRDSSRDVGSLRRSRGTKDHSRAMETTLAASSVAGSVEIPRPSTLTTLIPFAFLCGAILSLLHLAIGTWRVMQFRSAANFVAPDELHLMLDGLRKRLKLNRSVELRLHPEPVVPMTLGVFRPMIVLPWQSCEWSEQLKRIVLLHELAHVKRRDIAFQWLGRVACSLYWFHPLAWWGLKQLRRERELACDDLVVHCGERASDYADVLVSVAKNYQTQLGLGCAVAMAQQGNLEGRMRSLFDKDIVRSHKPLGRMVALSMLVAALLVVSAVSAMQLAAEPPSDEEVLVVFTPEEGAGSPEPEPAKPSEQSLLGAIGEGIGDAVGELVGEFAEGNGQYRVAGPLERTVKVIDESGKPVASAKIIPWGFGTENGTGWGWIEAWPREFITNAEGIGTVLVPEELTAIVPPESGDFTFISFRVEHKDFAPAVRDAFSESDGKQPVTLSWGVILAVKAMDSTTNQQITSDLYVVSSGHFNPKWKLEAGLLQSTPFNPNAPDTGRYFRVVCAPNDASGNTMKFSDVMDSALLEVKDHVAYTEIELHSGVELSGALSANVERPVKPGGRVIAAILSGSDQSCAWQDVAPIAADGTFKFAALPRESHVELIAVCDGWVSRSVPETTADYDRKYGTAFAQMDNGGLVASTPCRLGTDATDVIVNMVETGICKFKVVDEHGDPIELATIMLMPNQRNRAGSTYLGAGGRSIDALRKPESVPPGLSFDMAKSYIRVTNSQGIAVISNLPTTSQMVMVDFPGYVVVPDARYAGMGIFSIAVADIKEGELNQKTLQMRKADDQISPRNLTLLAADGTYQVKLRIVDADGVSMPNAKIDLVSQNISTLTEKQPWPVGWPTDFSLSTDGMATLRIPRSASVTAEDLAKASIWIDIEADGCVPLKNYEVSLSRRLPIRLQAAGD